MSLDTEELSHPTRELRYAHFTPAHTIVELGLWFAFFQLVNRIVIKYSEGGHKPGAWKRKNIFISCVHAMLTGCNVLYCLYAYPGLYHDVLFFQNSLIHTGICFTTGLCTSIYSITQALNNGEALVSVSSCVYGYFLYDMWDIWANGMSRQMWEVMTHHTLVIAAFLTNLLLNTCLSLAMLALVMEINSVFLHWRKLLHLTQVPFDSALYIVVKYLNLLTFIIARMGATFSVIYIVFSQGHRLPAFNTYLVSLAIYSLLIINSGLLLRILKSDFLRGRVKSKAHSNGFAAHSQTSHTNGSHMKS